MADRRSARERGAAAVEMAIVLPLLLLLIGGIVDMSRFMFTKSILTNSAREGARMVAVGYPEGSWPSPAAGTARKRIVDSLSGVAVANPNFSYSAGGSACPTSPGPTDAVTVTISTPAAGSTGAFQYLILSPISKWFRFGGNAANTAVSAPVLSATASMRCGG